MIIGEAVKQIPDDLKSKYETVPWNEIAGMRDILIHSYFRTDVRLIYKTAERDSQLSWRLLNPFSQIHHSIQSDSYVTEGP